MSPVKRIGRALSDPVKMKAATPFGATAFLTTSRAYLLRLPLILVVDSATVVRL